MKAVCEIIKTISLNFSKLILGCIVFFNNAEAQYNNDSVFSAATISNIQLHNVNANNNIFLITKQDAKPFTLFIFLSPDCPLCQNYSGTLDSLYQQYKNDVLVYGIIPGKAYSKEEIKKFIQQYDIQLPLLIDDDKKLTGYLH